MKRLLTALLCAVAPVAALADDFDGVIRATVLPGWRMENGDHMAGLRLELAPGWKTYWRSPGDAGIPPAFDWAGSRNLRAVDVAWPSPEVFWQSGMRSVGYTQEVILPLRVDLAQARRDARINATVDIGVCKDVCLPERLHIRADLPASTRAPDARIAAALADLPFTGEDVGATDVTCSVSAADRGIGLTVSAHLPQATGREDTVIEFADPALWVAEPKTSLENGRLVARTRVMHTSSAGFALDRSTMTLTVLGGAVPVEITGCR